MSFTLRKILSNGNKTFLIYPRVKEWGTHFSLKISLEKIALAVSVDLGVLLKLVRNLWIY